MKDSKPDPSTMKIKEIKDELTEMNISFAGCFDKESLMERLKDARSGKVIPEAQTSTNTQNNGTEKQSSAPQSNQKRSFDREKVLIDLRSKTIKELRTMCAQADIRWATMIEKEDYVKALLAIEEQRGDFSPSGKLTPGKVGNIGQDDVEKELKGRADTPLLLDVYATWCGPCKIMAPQLDEAASEWGSKIRVAKMDTDQNQELSSRLRIKGLPTVIIFDKNGKEIERVEGAMMKDQLGQFVNKYI
jgi:thioredoxin